MDVLASCLARERSTFLMGPVGLSDRRDASAFWKLTSEEGDLSNSYSTHADRYLTTFRISLHLMMISRTERRCIGLF